MAACVAPLVIVKTTERLKFSSYLAICAISLVIFCTYYSFFSKVHNKDLPKFNWWPSQYEKFDAVAAIGVLPTVFQAFNFHYNVLPIYKSFKNPNDFAYTRVIFLAQTCVGFCYLSVAVIG